MKQVNYISFHKRFTNGEQYLYISPLGDIETEGKTYFWQERGVYNRIKPIIEKLITNNPSISEAQLYGKNGIVARLVPIQRAYNAIKNRKHEYMDRLSLGLMIVEDGSIDLDNLEEEGLAPGKIIVYRQGSVPPNLLQQSTALLDAFSKEEDRLLSEFNNITQAYLAEQAIERIRLMADDAPIVCTKAEVVKEFAKKLKEFIDEYSTKVIGSEWSDSDKLLHSITCETIYNKINELTEQYG